MALTKISRGLLNTGVSDSSDATSITIDSSERVGINQSSPAVRLHVLDNGAEIARFEGNDEYAYIGLRGTVSGSATSLGYFGFANDTGTAADLNITNAQNGDIALRTNSTEVLRIEENGHVGIGTASPAQKFTVHGSDNQNLIMSSNSGGNSNTMRIQANNAASYIVSSANVPMIFDVNGTEKMRILGNGSVGVGHTSQISGGQLNVYSSADGGVVIGSSSGNNAFRKIYHDPSSGILYFTSTSNAPYLSNAGGWTNASDIAIKKDIVDIDYGLSTVESLQPRRYKMKADDENQVGFIAQEMESVIPELVGGEEGKKGINYSQLTAVLTKAIQELKTELDAAKARIETLENE